MTSPLQGARPLGAPPVPGCGMPPSDQLRCGAQWAAQQLSAGPPCTAGPPARPARPVAPIGRPGPRGSSHQPVLSPTIPPAMPCPAGQHLAQPPSFMCLLPCFGATALASYKVGEPRRPPCSWCTQPAAGGGQLLPPACRPLPARHAACCLLHSPRCWQCVPLAACCRRQVKKTVDKAFSSKKPEPPTEPAFVTEAKLRWNVSQPQPNQPALASAAHCLAATPAEQPCIHQHITPCMHPAVLPPPCCRLQLTGWKPSSAAATPPTQPEAPRSKRSDRWGDRQQSSKQRLAELVDQHKNKQQQAPSQQQASRR